MPKIIIMKSISIILVGLLISFAGTAQTKRIAQRSHSGFSENFVVDSEDNFGIIPEMSRKKKEEREAQAKKDSTYAKAARDSVEKAAVKKAKKSKGKSLATTI